jgi:SAM-dependent methyltransferase
MSRFSDLEVCRTVAPDDYMYKKLPESGKSGYFKNAADALALMDDLGRLAGHPFSQGSTILDYGAGYGRVTRYFAAFSGEKNVVACDIHPAAVDFCRDTLGVTAMRVHEPFNEIDFGRKFDWIFAGSVFTHINAAYWHQILELYARSLAPNGCVLLTTAGDKVAQLVNQAAFDDIAPGAGRAMYAAYEFGGFGYAQYINAEANNKNLGRCVVKPGWVFDFVDRYTNLNVLTYIKEGFWGRQDIFLLKAGPSAE